MLYLLSAFAIAFLAFTHFDFGFGIPQHEFLRFLSEVTFEVFAVSFLATFLIERNRVKRELELLGDEPQLLSSDIINFEDGFANDAFVDFFRSIDNHLVSVSNSKSIQTSGDIAKEVKRYGSEFDFGEKQVNSFFLRYIHLAHRMECVEQFKQLAWLQDLFQQFGQLCTNFRSLTNGVPDEDDEHLLVLLTRFTQGRKKYWLEHVVERMGHDQEEASVADPEAHALIESLLEKLSPFAEDESIDEE